MGIFSRRDKKSDAGAESAGQGSPPRPETPVAASNLVVNRFVQEALAPWSATKNAQTMNGVLRQCIAGDLLLDASGSEIADPATPFAKGDAIAIGTQVDNAGKRLLVAFTDNDRLAVYRRNGGATAPPISLGQPAAATLEMAASTYDGIAIDPGSPETLFIAYADEIRRGLTDQPGVNEALKTAVLAGSSADELVARAEAAPVLFVGVSTLRDDKGEVQRITVPAIKGPDGGSYHPAFTSPAEVWAWAPDLEARPTGFSNIARSAREDGQAGIAFDPAGMPGVVPIATVAGRY
jgi:hypothetical protein